MRRILQVLALLFLLAHLRALPHTLEDIDSINFAMGVESFDVAKHQPHPPGYPVYIALAKTSTAVLHTVAPGMDRDRSAAAGIAIWSVIAGALAALVIADFWMALGLTPVIAGLASILAVTSPLFWFTASRPLTDTPGLVAAVFVQTLFLRGLRAFRAGEDPLPRDWTLAAFGAGLIIGLRSQTMLLTGPLLLWAAGELVVKRRFKETATLAGAATFGVLLWAIPMVWDSGGVGAYLAALGSQGRQDFSGIEMLATMPSWRLLQTSLRRTFVDPWQMAVLGRVILLFTLVGIVWLARRGRPMLATILLGFWPYLIFHLTFHETVTIRYGLPLVVPMAGLAVIGLSALGVRVATVGAAAMVIAGLMAAVPRLEAYSANTSAVFRAFQDMQRERPRQRDNAPDPNQPILKTQHQVWHGVQRVIDWYRAYWDVGPQPFPGDREWQSIIRLFTSGGTRPVWFLTDLSRNDVKLFDWRTTRLRGRYELQPNIRELVGGARLDGLSWWSIERPRWMLGTGWALTPEIAGMTGKDHAGPHERPAEAFLLRDPAPARLMLGARYLAPAGSPPGNVSLTLDGQPLATWPISGPAPWFVQWLDLASGVPAGNGPYARLAVTVTSTDPSRPAPVVGLEQFDLAPQSDFSYAFLDDWNEGEGNPRTGQLWRWTTARSTIQIKGAASDLQLTLEGDSPLRDFKQAPTVVVRAGTRELARFTPSDVFSQQIRLPLDALTAGNGRVTIETSQTFVPRDRGAGADARTLGLKLFRAEIRRP